MARTRRMSAKARSTATNSSPPQPRPTTSPVAGQDRDAMSTPRQAQVANPVPFETDDSPSMMERFFPAGLPRRYTRLVVAGPASIGSVISSSQESSHSPSPAPGPGPAPGVSPVLCTGADDRTSPRDRTRSPPAPSTQPPAPRPPHGPDITAEDRIASFLRRSSSSSGARSSPPQPPTLAAPGRAPDATLVDRTPGPPPPSETDDETYDEATVTEDWEVPAGSLLPNGRRKARWRPSYSKRVSSSPLEHSSPTTRQRISSAPVADFLHAVPIRAETPWDQEPTATVSRPVDHAPRASNSAPPPEHVSRSSSLSDPDEHASVTAEVEVDPEPTPASRPVDHEPKIANPAPLEEHASPPLASPAYFASEDYDSASSRESATSSLLQSMHRTSKVTEASSSHSRRAPSLFRSRDRPSKVTEASSSHSRRPSLFRSMDRSSRVTEASSSHSRRGPTLPNAMVDIWEVPDSVSSRELASASSLGAQERAAETPGTSPFEGPPKDAHESRPSTPDSSSSNDGLAYIVIELGSVYNSPESRSVSPVIEAPAASRPSRKRKATETAKDMDVPKAKRAKTPRVPKTPIPSTPKKDSKQVARKSIQTPAPAATSRKPSPAKPSAKQDAARKSTAGGSSQKPAKAAPPKSPKHRVTKPSQGKPQADVPYGLRSRETRPYSLRSRETRKVTAKVAMNMELDAEEGTR